MVRVPQNAGAGHPRRHLLEQFDCLSCELVVHIRDASDIPAGPPEAGHQSACDRVVAPDDDDRNRRRGILDDWGQFAPETAGTRLINPLAGASSAARVLRPYRTRVYFKAEPAACPEQALQE